MIEKRRPIPTAPIVVVRSGSLLFALEQIIAADALANNCDRRFK